MSTADLIELIKALGGAIGVVITAITLGYARVGAKRSKEASLQTTTSEFVDGELRSKSTATTSAETASKVEQLKNQSDTVLARLLHLESEVGQLPGTGQRRAPDPDWEDPW